MGFIPAEDLIFVRAVSELSNANPFLPARLELEKPALGERFVAEPQDYWGFTSQQMPQRRSNLVLIIERAQKRGRIIAEQVAQRDLGRGQTVMSV